MNEICAAQTSMKDDRFQVQKCLRSFHSYIAKHVEKEGGIVWMFSNLSLPFYNAVFTDEGVDQKTYLKHLDILKDRKIPFVWFADADSAIEKDLIENGGKSIGVFQGGTAILRREMCESPSRSDIEARRVSCLEDLAKQVDLISLCLKLDDEKKKARFEIAKSQMGEQSPMQHWIAIKEGRAVAIIGLFITEKCALMMNAITDEAFRNLGIATFLACEALKFAMEQGCDKAVTCIDPGEKAKGIALKFKGSVQWRYTPIIFQGDKK